MNINLDRETAQRHLGSVKDFVTECLYVPNGVQTKIFEEIDALASERFVNLTGDGERGSGKTWALIGVALHRIVFSGGHKKFGFFFETETECRYFKEMLMAHYERLFHQYKASIVLRQHSKVKLENDVTLFFLTSNSFIGKRLDMLFSETERLPSSCFHSTQKIIVIK